MSTDTKNNKSNRKASQRRRQKKQSTISRAEIEKRRSAERKAAENAMKEAAKSLKPTLPRQKVPFGVNPKTILCQYFKIGKCDKGDKCKFSHDMSLADKKEEETETKKEDPRKKDTMDNWDEKKLRQVIAENEKASHHVPSTTKICKYFLEAIEEGRYGWFWICPNTDSKLGMMCKYTHALPPEFVLKTKEQRKMEKLAEQRKNRMSLEDYIERDRNNLDRNQLTPMTQETFSSWKKNHRQKLLNEKSKKQKAKLTGREIVLSKFQDRYFREEEEEEGNEVDMTDLRNQLREIELKELGSQQMKDYGDGSKAFAIANGIQ